MAATCRFPEWRFVSTDLDSNVTTILDRVATQRHVHPILNVPNWLSFNVPSDSRLVNTPYPTDVDTEHSYVDEGDRLIYAFRKESDTPPYFQCRAAGISLQVEDSAEQDEATTKVTAFDPWKLAYCRPAQASDGDLPVPMGTWDGTYAAGTTADIVILTQLLYTILNDGIIRIDAGDGSRSGEGPQYQDWGGTAYYQGTLEVAGAIVDPYTVTAGQSVGDVWTAMVAAAYCDIVLTPIFDPINRPGYTHEMSIFVQAGHTTTCIYGWDRPPHNLTQISRMIDGTQRANKIKFGAGQGGVYGVSALQTDAASVTQYGQYWGQQFLPAEVTVEVVEALAAFQLSLRANGRTVVQFSPTPNRSPCPFVDFNLGDIVSAYASREAFRFALAGEMRVYGFPLDIADDATEQVQGMILLPGAA